MNGLPCSRNTPVSFRAFFIIQESFSPVILSCCVHLSLLSLPYSAANSCSNLDSSGAMRKELASAFSFSVRFSCSIPWSGVFEVNPATIFVTQKFPFMNSAQRSGCCISVTCIVVMYRESKRAWFLLSCVKKYLVRYSICPCAVEDLDVPLNNFKRLHVV